jgi:hypothetical protein
VITTMMPCLRCGKPLDSEAQDDLVCVCGSMYDIDEVKFYTKPGYYREWLAALGCACGRVDHYTEHGVLISPHRCTGGGVMYMDSPYSNN